MMLPLFRNDVSNKWLIPPDGNKDTVTCIDCYDMTGNGLNNIIIGRADGLIEVFSFISDQDQLKEIYSYVRFA